MVTSSLDQQTDCLQHYTNNIVKYYCTKQLKVLPSSCWYCSVRLGNNTYKSKLIGTVQRDFRPPPFFSSFQFTWWKKLKLENLVGLSLEAIFIWQVSHFHYDLSIAGLVLLLFLSLETRPYCLGRNKVILWSKNFFIKDVAQNRQLKIDLRKMVNKEGLPLECLKTWISTSVAELVRRLLKWLVFLACLKETVSREKCSNWDCGELGWVPRMCCIQI